MSQTDERRHVLLYTDRPGIYGAEQCNHAVSCALAAAGYRVTFVQPEADHHLIAARERQGIAHRWLRPDDIYDLSRPARTLTDAEEPHHILSAARPDLILFSDSSPFSNLKAKQVAQALGIPYLVVVHCVNPAWVVDYAPYLSELPAAYARAAAVIAVSQANLDLLQELFGLPAGMGRVIIHGRPPVFFEPPDPTVKDRVRRALGITAETIVCLTVARLEVSKGYQHQLEALIHLQKCPAWPRLTFLWVGTGTMAGRLQTYVRLLRCEAKVHFLGERHDVPDLLAAADMFVLPSQFEGMPLVVMEAMARGLPVAATAVSGTPEAIGEAGHLLPAGGPALPQELAKIVCRWAGRPDLRRDIGAAAKERAEALFQEEQTLKAYLKLIKKHLVHYEKSA